MHVRRWSVMVWAQVLKLCVIAVYSIISCIPRSDVYTDQVPHLIIKLIITVSAVHTSLQPVQHQGHLQLHTESLLTLHDSL